MHLRTSLMVVFLFIADGVHAAGLQEVETDDVRLTYAGVDGDVSVSVDYTALAYNADANEYLLAWRQEDTPDVYEVYAQVLGADLVPSGAIRRVSFMGSNDADTQWGVYDGVVESQNQNDAGHRLENVAVAYDSTHQKYLVVWSGDDDQVGLVDGEYEVFGQLLNADGTRFGVPTRLSAVGADGDANTDAYSPAVDYDATSDRFLVVWEADGENDGRYQIEGVMLSVDAAGVGEYERFANLSNLDNGGDAADVRYSAYSPTVAAAQGAFLVAWDGFDAVRGGPNNRNIFWRTVTAMGAGNLQYLENVVEDAWPIAAFFTLNNEFVVQFQHKSLLAWLSSAIRIDVDGILISNTPKFLGHFASGNEAHAVIAADAIRNLLIAAVNRDYQDITQIDVNLIGDVLTGETPFHRISASAFPPSHVAAAYNAVDGEFAVAWRGELASGEAEIFGQRLAVSGVTNLAITAFDAPSGAVNAGEDALVTLTVENLGANDAENVSLAFSISGNSLLVSGGQVRNVTTGAAAFNCDVVNNYCALGIVGAGEKYRVDLAFDTSAVAQSAPYTVDITLSSGAIDSDGSDNAATKTFSVSKNSGGNPSSDGNSSGGGGLGFGILAALVVLRRKSRRQ